MEVALLQGFQLDYKWAGSKICIACQIDNAVPVGLARAIAGALHHCLCTPPCGPQRSRRSTPSPGSQPWPSSA
ncbi:DNA cytosine methyltransferase [Nonomuraea sp. NPDC052116]|uniref:DNA cytosine methyltransferase n=1 Tax=Nonomuraea sp. NPDC052116 TaxID=3155665 RepID=UPI003443AFE0